MTLELKNKIKNDGYEAFFLRGETKNDNPFVEDLEEYAFEAWEEGRARAESDCE